VHGRTLPHWTHDIRGADDTRYFGGNYGTEPVQNIAAARYTVNVPSWAGATPVAMTAADGAFNSTRESVTATINTTGWAPGRPPPSACVAR
jgi:carboxypeptidase T